MVKISNIILILLITSVLVIASGCSGTNNNVPSTPTPTSAPTQESTPALTPTPEPETTNVSTQENTSVSTPEPINVLTGTAQIYYVNITHYAFVPASLNVSTGDTVVWTNLDSTKYYIRGANFNSPMLNRGSTFSYTFTQPGEYIYIDPQYSGMRGSVIVQGAAVNSQPITTQTSNNTIQLRPEVSYGSNQSFSNTNNENNPTPIDIGGNLNVIPAKTSSTIIVNDSSIVGNPQRNIVLDQNRTQDNGTIIAAHTYS